MQEEESKKFTGSFQPSTGLFTSYKNRLTHNVWVRWETASTDDEAANMFIDPLVALIRKEKYVPRQILMLMRLGCIEK